MPDVTFRDDPLHTRDAIAASDRAGMFGSVREVTMREGIARVDYNVRITDEGKF